MNNKLILGTVQFGLDYGINNTIGKPSKIEVFRLLDIAYEKGIRSLDTADAYGDSIDIIGDYHRTKRNKFKILNKFRGVGTGEIGKIAEYTLGRLDIDRFEVYSFHSYADYLDNKFVLNELNKLKKKGLVNKIGISVYTNSEIEKVIVDKDLDVIQLPYNILDNSNLRGILIDKAKGYGKEIHVRSVFLQGLFFTDFERFPEKLNPLKLYIQNILDICKAESSDIHSLALSYAVFNKNINNVLIGVDSKTQLLKNIESIQNNQKVFDIINNKIFVKETELLNPVNWK
jgi:uncharacterized protein